MQRLSTIVPRPLLFAAVGCLNTAVDFLAFWALITWTGLPPLIANVASFSLGAANSFVVNGLFTFADREIRLALADRVVRFMLVTLACLVVSTLALWLALPAMPALAAKIVSIAVTLGFGYVLNSRLVFR